jgi:FkbM family methyltransferase
MIRQAIDGVLGKLGYEIRRRRPELAAATMEGALLRAAARGVKVGTVIDVGASDGTWSRLCMKAFPEASYLLVEAQEPHRAALEAFAARHPRVAVVLAAAGARKGTIWFDNGDLFGGLASEVPLPGPCIEVPVTTIDAEVEARGLRPPYLVKLDTHGFEVPILEGARRTLADASLVVLEEYVQQLTSSSLRHVEMGRWMGEAGFRPVDVVDLTLREKDHSLWQMDVFYQPSAWAGFRDNAFE